MSFEFSAGTAGFLSSQNQGNWPYLEMRWGTRPSSNCGRKLGFHSSAFTDITGNPSVAYMESSLLLRFQRVLRIASTPCRGKRASSRIEGGISWFFSKCNGELGFPLEL